MEYQSAPATATEVLANPLNGQGEEIPLLPGVTYRPSAPRDARFGSESAWAHVWRLAEGPPSDYQGYSQDKPKRCSSPLALLLANCAMGVVRGRGVTSPRPQA